MSTGYEGVEKAEPGSPKFELVRVERYFSAAPVAASLMRNGVSVGLIFLESEEEFQWLKNAIEQARRI